jgi:hypothetical protein
VQEYKQDPSVARNDPAYMRSRLPEEKGNSPHYHPEDLRPSSEKQMELQRYTWLDKAGGVARIPIDEAMKLVLTAKNPNAKDKSFLLFQMRDGKPVELKDLLRRGPTPSNPQGSGSTSSMVKPPSKPSGGHE